MKLSEIITNCELPIKVIPSKEDCSNWIPEYLEIRHTPSGQIEMVASDSDDRAHLFKAWFTWEWEPYIELQPASSTEACDQLTGTINEDWKKETMANVEAVERLHETILVMQRTQNKIMKDIQSLKATVSTNSELTISNQVELNKLKQCKIVVDGTKLELDEPEELMNEVGMIFGGK